MAAQTRTLQNVAVLKHPIRDVGSDPPESSATDGFCDSNSWGMPDTLVIYFNIINSLWASEAGREQVVRVRRDAVAAIRMGLEPCALTREGVGEASAEERIGQPLSRVSDFLRGVDSVSYVEGNTSG
jgi:hypothetical protein